MWKISVIIRLYNHICWKIQSDLSTSFIPDFNLLSSELVNFTFKLLHWLLLFWYYVNPNLGRIIRGEGGLGDKTTPCLKSVRIMLETYNVGDARDGEAANFINRLG